MSVWRTAAVLSLLALAAQTPQFRSGVDVARFDVVVLDKDRRPITGLTAADFRITEDGRPLRVAAFEAVTIPAASAPPPAAAAGPPASAPIVETVTNRRDVPGRLIVIVMDRTIPYERPLITARAVANAAVDAMGPNDLGAVIFTSGFARRPQGFTASRERLRAAIASLEMGATTDVTMTPQGLARGGIGSNPGDSCPCGGCTMSALTTIANALIPVNDYRKMILFIGGDLALGENGALASTPECRGMVREPSLALHRALDRANVTVHTVDPRGLETTATTADNTPPESADARMNRQGNLQALPEYTGGRTIAGSNEPERLVSALFAEDRTYYVLAVERDRPRPDGKPHSVTFEVARPGATVLGRNAYYDAVDVPRGRSSDPLERAIAELLPRTDLPLRMTLAPGRDKSSTVDVTLATPRTAPARADVLVAVFDQFAKQVGSERARVELPARGGADVEWKMHLKPKPGRYEVRAAVRIGDAIGTIAGYVDVPKASGRAEAVPPTAAPPGGDASAAPASPAPRSAALDAILAQAGTYVEQYGDPQGGLLLDELYRQNVMSSQLGTRTLKSDLLIVHDQAEGWVQFRDVLSVDGKKVADREDRLARLFSAPSQDPREQARRLTEEGARHNFSGDVVIRRSLNQPLAALLYLRTINQPRSHFTLAGGGGRDGQHVTFSEQQQPRLIGATGNAGANGEFWIDAATGEVRRAILRIVSRASNVIVTATILVRYERDAKTGLALPVMMEERYVVSDPRGNLLDMITGEARYSNPRQFKVTADK